MEDFDKQSLYQITVLGTVNSLFIRRIADLDVVSLKQGAKEISTLTGMFEGPEALNGMLNTLFEHRYTVISINKI